ncbi:MAG: hypothetical protein E6J41_00865 [Chloroflexi bacterium]|nr:MAG: hypothetical protein E6J41_00865 [Chloroflexota bacterium]
MAGTTLGIPAVLLLGGRSVLTSRIRLVLDGSIVALAVLLVSWLTVLHTVWAAGGADSFTFALGVYYPAADVVTVAVVLSTISTARHLNPALLVVGAGLICFSFSDSAYAYLTAVGAYSGSNVIDVGWVAGYLLLGLASLIGRDQHTITDARLARWQIVLPYVPLAVALSVVIANFTGSTPIRDRRAGPGAPGLAGRLRRARDPDRAGAGRHLPARRGQASARGQRRPRLDARLLARRARRPLPLRAGPRGRPEARVGRVRRPGGRRVEPPRAGAPAVPR